MKKLVLMSLSVLLILITACSTLNLRWDGNGITGNVVKEQSQVSQEVVEGKDICYEEDGGLNFDKRSVVTGSKDSKAFMKMDICVGNVLQEYYCENKELKLQNNICENGCYAGKCE
jgi:hypothetical protein